jgi:RNA polymerase sigma factor (sigma-70 family)
MEQTADDLTPILERSIAGDFQALEQLFGRLRPFLHWMARRLLGPTSTGALDHSSMVQRSLVRIYQRLGELRTRKQGPLLAWAGFNLRRVIDDARRQERKMPRSLGAEVPEVAARAESDADDEPRHRTALLTAAALERLSPDQRQLVEWHVLEKVPHAEIGRRLGVSENTARQRFFRAVTRLRLALEPELGSEQRAFLNLKGTCKGGDQ